MPSGWTSSGIVFIQVQVEDNSCNAFGQLNCPR